MKRDMRKCSNCDGHGYCYWKQLGRYANDVERVQKPNIPNDQIPNRYTEVEGGGVCKEKCFFCPGKGILEDKQWPSVSEFIAKMGEPFKKQELQGAMFWYYNCSDGVVQLQVAMFSGQIAWYRPDLY